MIFENVSSGSTSSNKLLTLWKVVRMHLNVDNLFMNLGSKIKNKLLLDKQVL
jgi:hypothetical protein